jgi:2,4-dienoyl-CoA reductase-like NADH-dependent reductase (Old Yellow Enzyme family)
MPTLFDPVTIGDLTLPNRIIMAPLTRLRAGAAQIPDDLMVQYYRQRASAGLIISEGVPVSKQAVGYHGVSGIWSDEQIGGWKAVTRAVREAGGRIFIQNLACRPGF